jgi:hypothetical protein
LKNTIKELEIEKVQHVETLKREQYQFLVKEAGMENLHYWIEDPAKMVRSDVQKAFANLDNFLIKGDVNYQLEDLSDRSLAASISIQASKQIVRLFGDFIQVAAANGLSDLINRSVGELETLLSIGSSDLDINQVIKPNI